MTSRILLDVDGVLGDFVSPVLAWAGGKYTRDSITDHDILKAWNAEHLQDELDAFCGQPGFCESLPLMPGAQEFVERLRRRFEVVVVTSPYGNVPTWSFERLRWLERHFGIPKQDVIFCKRKELVRGAALVEDRIENLENFRGLRFLIDAPWNRREDIEIDARCKDLSEVADELESWMA